MTFHVYPEKLRMRAKFLVKIRYYLLALLFIGILVFFAGLISGNAGLIILGALAGTAGTLFFVTIRAKDVLIGVEIREDGVHVVDDKGVSFRSSEYRYVRNIEARFLQVTEIAFEGNKHYGKGPRSGIAARFILVYIDSASSFSDLGLDDLSKDGSGVYWHDKLLHHNSCIAFEYSEDAWDALMMRLCNSSQAFY